jgi:4-hydroxymandelate oxidase
MKQREPRLPVNLAEFEALARAVLPTDAFDHIAGGADDELTLKDNVAAFCRIKLVPRVLRDVTRRNLSTTLLGEPIEFPVILAPVACLRRFHPEGELAAARGAGQAGTIFTLSTGACHSLEEVAQAACGPLWFQLYAYQDRGITQGLVERAEVAGYKAICLTVDVPIGTRRERDLRNGYIYPAELLRQSLLSTGFTPQDLELDEEQLSAFAGRALQVALTWDYLHWLKSLTSLPILLKGILSEEDASRAVSSGVQAIVVSNHGGRQLDGSPAAIDVLSRIVEAVDGRAEILLDSGVRRGTDVLKAIALGAKAVLIGRPFVWALAVGGQSGVESALQMLRNELDIAMALTGCACISDIERKLIWRNQEAGPPQQ